MNFLAHLYLSGQDEHLMVGNFLADFIGNKEVANLPPDIQKGVAMHRQIDSFTDKHPMVRQGARRLHASHGKYAPVILDVFHDFLLAQNWGRYSSQTLPEFSRGAYEVLLRHLDIMPTMLHDRLPRMVADDWLVRYGTEDGLRFTFSRVKLRSSSPQFFENAVESLTIYYQDFNEEFNSFFPDIIGEVNPLLLPNQEF
jgi:acyl carrier protein phosphodiesterase